MIFGFGGYLNFSHNKYEFKKTFFQLHNSSNIKQYAIFIVKIESTLV